MGPLRGCRGRRLLGTEGEGWPRTENPTRVAQFQPPQPMLLSLSAVVATTPSTTSLRRPEAAQGTEHRNTRGSKGPRLLTARRSANHRRSGVRRLFDTGGTRPVQTQPASWRFPRPRPCPPPLDDASRDWVERRLLKEGWVGCSSDGWGGGRQVTGKITPSGQTQPSTQRESPATVGGRGHRLPTTPGTTSSCGSPIRRARRRYPGPPSRLRAATPDEGRRGRWRPSWDRHRPRRWRIRPTRSLPARG